MQILKRKTSHKNTILIYPAEMSDLVGKKWVAVDVVQVDDTNLKEKDQTIVDRYAVTDINLLIKTAELKLHNGTLFYVCRSR